MSDLDRALSALGEDDATRDEVVAACIRYERRHGVRAGDLREIVTGPIVDALFEPGTIIRRVLADGSVFNLSYRSKIARELVLAPETPPDHVWEPQTTRLLIALATGGRRAVIGGGYVGDQAVFVARALAPGGSCLAFEPNGESADLMRQNAALNGVDALEVRELALWDVDGARLDLIGDDSHAHPQASGTGALEAVSLDAVAAREGWMDEGLDLLMLDIEGGETAALRGAIALLDRPAAVAPSIVFEIHRSYVDWSDGLASTAPVRLLLDLDYEVLAIRDFQSNVPMAGCKIELVPIDDIYLEGPPHGFNLVAVKQRERLEGSAFRRCPGRSPKLLLHRDPSLHHPTEWLEALPPWLTPGSTS